LQIFPFPTTILFGYFLLESEEKMTKIEIQNLIDDVIDREGGYVDHPADRGGATNWGITQSVARQNGFDGPMQKLPRELAVTIYTQQYWQKPGFEAIARHAPALAEELFDTGINMGTATATSFLQRALNALNRNGKDYPDIKIDRKIGPATLAALEQFLSCRGRNAELILKKAVDALQGAHYLRLAETRPSQEAFLYGWLANRLG
jgi:lysozyme family protein